MKIIHLIKRVYIEKVCLGKGPASIWYVCLQEASLSKVTNDCVSQSSLRPISASHSRNSRTAVGHIFGFWGLTTIDKHTKQKLSKCSENCREIIYTFICVLQAGWVKTLSLALRFLNTSCNSCLGELNCSSALVNISKVLVCRRK